MQYATSFNALHFILAQMGALPTDVSWGYGSAGH